MANKEKTVTLALKRKQVNGLVAIVTRYQEAHKAELIKGSDMEARAVYDQRTAFIADLLEVLDTVTV